jgi:hypothetical protein
MHHKHRVWNRAAFDSAGDRDRRENRALADLLLFHGYVMNGGLGHGFDLSTDEVAAALDGFRFFGFTELADFLAGIVGESGERQEELSSEYRRFVPSDATLVERFEEHYRDFPDDFAPAADD